MNKFSFRINKEFSKARLDRFLAVKFEDLSRSWLQRLIKKGYVTLNNIITTKPDHLLKENDIVLITVPELPPLTLKPEPLELDKVYEDDHILVINKPPSLTVHPYGNKLEGTLVNALLYNCHQLSGIAGPLKPGIVHRLDKDTSGVMIIAKDDKTHLHLIDQFKRRFVEKEYLALVHGYIKEEEVTINFSIGRNSKNRMKMSIHAKKSKEAKTSVRCLERFKAHSFVNVRIYTGRTHQIRVHLASLHNPVVGDKKYGGKSYLKKDNLGMIRQALHAYRISFQHPDTKEKVSFEAPLPEDFTKALDRARKGEKAMEKDDFLR